MRYGILKSDWSQISIVDEKEEEGIYYFETKTSQLAIHLADGRFVLTDKATNKCIIQSVERPFVIKDNEKSISLQLSEGERLFGLGDSTRDRIQVRGLKKEMWIANTASYIPIPWIMSSGHWGFLANTTYRHILDIGCTQPNIFTFSGKFDELDFYLFSGKSLSELLDYYTQLSGRPLVLPAWAYWVNFCL